MRSLLSAWLDNPLGDRVRHLLGHNPPRVSRPMRKASVVSDIFPWRVDDTWETRFELMNVPSFLMPETAGPDRVEFQIFDSGGRLVHAFLKDVAPFTRVQIDLAEHLSGHCGYGGFACFHAGGGAPGLKAAASHLCERGYVGFKRRHDKVWSYVHGNQAALASPGWRGVPELIHGWAAGDQVYRPQLSFDDCLAAEIFLTNPTARRQAMTLNALDAARNPVARRRAEIPPGGSILVDFDIRAYDIRYVECVGRPNMWRPVVFKHYETHFDVLHS